METPMVWLPILLGAVVLLAVTGAALLIRVGTRARSAPPEQRAELAATPMTPLQRRAWWGLGIGVLTLVTLFAIIARAGAVAYWEDDALRLTVMLLFIAGLTAQAILPGLAMFGGGGQRPLGERDRAILARAPVAQSAAVLLTLAVWVVALAARYHDQAAVPMVYLYLIFGSVVLVNMTAQSLGIVLGYRFGGSSAQG